MAKKLVGFSFLILIELAFIPTIAFVLIELIEIHQSFSFISTEYLISTLLTYGTYHQFFSGVNPINAIGWLMIGMSVIFSVLNLFGVGVKNKKTYSQKENYGSHGTSRWQSTKEIKSGYFKNDLGWYLGGVKQKPYDPLTKGAVHALKNKTELNSQVNCIGPPGSKKSTGLLWPNIFHIPLAYEERNKRLRKKKQGLMKWLYSKEKTETPDLIITDPKSELYVESAEFLREMDYDIYVLDFIHLKYGSKVNSLDFIEEEKHLMEIADGFISTQTSSGGSTDPIWQNGEKLLLASLIGFVKQRFPKDRQNFNSIDELLTLDELNNPKKAPYFFRDNNIEGAPRRLFDKFIKTTKDAEKMRSGIMGGLSIKLSLFAIDGIQNITSETTVPLEMMGRKKEKPMALFILMPDEDETFAPIISVTVQSILNRLYTTARQLNEGNKLDNPVFMMLEEMANIGRISSLPKKLSTMRGRRIYPLMIWQSLAQMKERYKDEWEDMLSQCDTQLVLGVNDQTSAKHVSDELGSTTISTQGTSSTPGTTVWDKTQKSESYNYTSRNLLLPDEVKRFDNQKLIVIQRASYPFSLYKTQYKYWEEKHRLCNRSPLDALPLLNGDDSMLDDIEQEPEDEVAAAVIEERNVDTETGEILDDESVNEYNDDTNQQIEAQLDDSETDNTEDVDGDEQGEGDNGLESSQHESDVEEEEQPEEESRNGNSEEKLPPSIFD